LVFLHEVAHARFHAAALQPSKGKVLPPVRSSTFKGEIFGVKDRFDEVRADTQALEWFQFAGKGPTTARLFRLQKWAEE
jgi:hypothetical protein